MRKFALIIGAAVVIMLGYIGMATDNAPKTGNHTLPACDFAAMANEPDVTACWDAENGNVVMDSGRYTWNDRTGTLTDYGK